MEQQYITHLAEAYQRGYEKKYAGVDNAPEDKIYVSLLTTSVASK